MKKSKKNNQSSRRNFLKNTSLAAAGFFIVPRHVLGRGYIAPSDKLNIAGIGAGGKGTSDLAEFAKSPKVTRAYEAIAPGQGSARSRARAAAFEFLRGRRR